MFEPNNVKLLAAKDAEIQKLQQELHKIKEESKIISAKVEITAWQKSLLTFSVDKDFFIYFNQHENYAILVGKHELVRKYKFDLLEQLNQLKVEHLSLTPAMRCILSKELGKQYLLNLNSSHKNTATVFLQDESLLVVAKTLYNLKSVTELLESVLNHKETMVFDVIIPKKKLQLLQSTLEQRLLVICSYNGTVISFEGIKDGVMESTKEVRKFAANLRNHKMNVPGSQSLSDKNHTLKKAEQENQDKLQTVATIDKLQANEAGIQLEEDCEIHENPIDVTGLHSRCIQTCLKQITQDKSVILMHTELPRRGTYEFLRYAAESSAKQVPSYWNLHSYKDCQRFFWPSVKSDISNISKELSLLVDVDTKTKDALTKLITATFSLKCGYKIKVIDVKRIENLELFEPYSAQRQLLFMKMSEMANVCPDIGKLEGSTGRITTTEHLEEFMKEELYCEINEHYLFHGTKFPADICLNGIDPSGTSEGGMFGKGIYTSEKFAKSDQYTDSAGQQRHVGKTLTMILARVLLGNVFLCTNQSKDPVKLTGPPCMVCPKDKCECVNPRLYDSVMGNETRNYRDFVVYERNETQNYRDFVVYDRNQFYPEYLIYYQRI